MKRYPKMNVDDDNPHSNEVALARLRSATGIDDLVSLEIYDPKKALEKQEAFRETTLDEQSRIARERKIEFGRRAHGFVQKCFEYLEKLSSEDNLDFDSPKVSRAVNAIKSLAESIKTIFKLTVTELEQAPGEGDLVGQMSDTELSQQLAKMDIVLDIATKHPEIMEAIKQKEKEQ